MPSINDSVQRRTLFLLSAAFRHLWKSKSIEMFHLISGTPPKKNFNCYRIDVSWYDEPFACDLSDCKWNIQDRRVSAWRRFFLRHNCGGWPEWTVFKSMDFTWLSQSLYLIILIFLGAISNWTSTINPSTRWRLFPQLFQQYGTICHYDPIVSARTKLLSLWHKCLHKMAPVVVMRQLIQ